MSTLDDIDNRVADADSSRVGFLFNGVPLDEGTPRGRVEQENRTDLMHSQGSRDDDDDDGQEEEYDRYSEQDDEDYDEGRRDGQEEEKEDGYDDQGDMDDDDDAPLQAGAANGLFADMGFAAPGSGGDGFGETDEREEDNIKFTYGSFDFQPDSTAAAIEGEFDSAFSDEEGTRRAAAIEAPKMPVTFYEDVNAFLSRAPPQMGSGSAPSSKKTPKGASSALTTSSTASAAAVGAVVPSGKPKSLKSKIKQIEKQRQLDESLLHEAFAYAERLNRETAAVEELIARQRPSPRDRVAKKGREQQQHLEEEAPSNRLLSSALSAPVLGSQAHAASQSKPSAGDLYGHQAAKASSGGKKTKGGRDKGRDQNKGGMVGRLRSKTAGDTASGGAFSNLSASSLDVLHQQQQRRSGLDIDSLVENFQKGILLNQLRQELAASKQSLQDSDAYMKQMSKDFMSRRK